MKSFYKKIIISILLAVFLTISSFVITVEVQAQSAADNMLWGGYETNTQVASGLGNTDIRIVIGNIVRIALGFLGVVAVIFILYGGWLWMTSAGDPTQVDKAKKVLISAVIGLVIMLFSFGIATFIMNNFYDATGATGGGESGGSGTVPGPGPGTTLCDENTLTPECNASNAICDESYPSGTYFCDADAGCTCQPLGGLGDACDADIDTPACDADDDRCQADLRCETEPGPNECRCVGAPIIDWISPVGRFCLDASNAPTNNSCRTNDDCVEIDPNYTCDEITPNGAPGNFLTIGGRFFGDDPGRVLFWDGDGFDVEADFPDTVNTNCTNNWQDDQVIVVIPGGAMTNGPIMIERSDSDTDTTNNDRGAMFNDFVRNSITRPGLCLAENTEPGSLNLGRDQGFFEEAFNLQGISFNGADHDAFFGNINSNVRANDVAGWTNTAVNATVPNILAGDNTVFVEVDDEASNYLIFDVVFDYDNQPVIDYIYEDSGPPGQYITIYGSGFQAYVSGTSEVLFSNTSLGDFTADGLNFPAECRDYWWTPRYIIVEVPRGITDLGDYNVTVTNNAGNTSEPEVFPVTTGTPGPGICLLSPHNGPINQAVNIYGDNLGDTQGSSFVRFYNNETASVYSGWANQLISTRVPTGAQTGPVNVSDGVILNSNSLPFTVGYCASASDCFPSEECCGSGTYWSGICRPNGDCSVGGPTTTGYGWSFTTREGPESPPPTCGGYSGGAECAAVGACPNSLGQCSTRSEIVTGECSDDYCNTNPLCAGNCVYDNVNNLCRAATLPLRTLCDQTSSSVVTDHTAECRLVRGQYNGQRVWQVNTRSCPAGTFPDTNGWCTAGVPGTPILCASCDPGFSCFGGQCFIASRVCPSGSNCEPVSGNCILGNRICECCCRTTLGANDCCYGLMCESGGCGDDPVNYGLCTGCRVELNGNTGDVTPDEQTASNLACNCQGTYGKYCDIDLTDPGNTGVCRDAEPCDNDLSNSVCDIDQDMCGAGKFCDIDCFCKPAPSCDTDPLTDGCNAPTNCDPATQFCDSSDCFCKPRRRCDNDNNINNGCGAQNNCDLSTEYCDDNCYCQPQISCNEDDDLTFCEREDRCLVGQTCDPTDCLCKPDEGPIAAPCVSVFPACTTGFYGCSANYDCIDNAGADCRCCCDPNNDQCEEPLTCWPNRGDCTGAERGLCCGCTSDMECNGGVNGCGRDTCCYARPAVTAVNPLDDSTDICRNPSISVNFNQAMDPKSFIGNVIVVGDYGFRGVCPAGTQYLALNGEELSQKNIFVRAFYKVINILKPILPKRFAQAYTPANSTTNYCAVAGSSRGYNNTAGEGVLTFDLNNALDANRLYYVIIKGDPVLNDNQSIGVLNFWGVGMRSNATAAADYTFNGINFVNSHIWSFRTGNDICELSYITVNPPSYLFQTTAAGQPAEADRSFEAIPRAINGQAITAVIDYNWQWSWSSDSTIVATVTDTDNPIQTVAPQVVEDGRTYINARARITTDNIINPSTAGQTITGRAQVFVMLCENPWPPVVGGVWYPWRDNVEGAPPACTGNCNNTNYEIYYCRDAGGVGTYDDLPALIDDSTIVLGSTLKCTDNASSCAGLNYGNPCGFGVCEYDIYKEAYFFREDVPNTTTVLGVESLALGQGVNVFWDIIPAVRGYKLYWGRSSGSYDNYADIDDSSATGRDDIDCVVNTAPNPDQMSCDITGLSNNATYYFNLTSYIEAESAPFGEAEVTVRDITPPPAPILLNLIVGDTEMTLNWTTSSGADKYIVYFTNEESKALIPEYPFYSDPVESLNLTIPGLTNDVVYYFAVTAVDASGNEGEYSNQLSGAPELSSCGNNLCDPGECDAGCTRDCDVLDCCGREGCNPRIGETGVTCEEDCGGGIAVNPPVNPDAFCPNGICEAGECAANCVDDCTVEDCCAELGGFGEGCNLLIGEDEENCPNECADGMGPPGDPDLPPIGME